MANSTVGPAPSQYSSIEAVVTLQPSGQTTTLPIGWLSNGCRCRECSRPSLAPGTYSLEPVQLHVHGLQLGAPEELRGGRGPVHEHQRLD